MQSRYISWIAVACVALCATGGVLLFHKNGSTENTEGIAPFTVAARQATSSTQLPPTTSSIQGRTVDRTSNATGGKDGRETRAARIAALIQSDSDSGFAELLELYGELAGRSGTYAQRTEILQKLAEMKDTRKAESLIRQAVSKEILKGDGIGACAFGGSLLIGLWGSDSARFSDARNVFITSESAPEKLALAAAMFTMPFKPEGLAADCASVYYSTQDTVLRNAILLNIHTFGDKVSAMAILSHALGGSLAGDEDVHAVHDALLGLSKLTQKMPETRAAVSPMLVELAMRSDCKDSVFREAISQLKTVDRGALESLASIAASKSDESFMYLMDAMQEAGHATR